MRDVPRQAAGDRTAEATTIPIDDVPPLIALAARIGLTYHLGGGVTTGMLTSRCGLRPGQRVLEVGCGTGRTAAHIAGTLGCRVVAADAHPRMVEWTRRHVDQQRVADRVEVVQADVRDLPWSDNSFDRVICESLLVFVPDPAGALREMVRVTRPGGLVGCNEGTLLGAGEPPDRITTFIEEALVGMTFAPAAVWRNRLHDAGLTRLSAEQRQLRITDELWSSLRWIGVREYARVMRRSVRLYRDDPHSRDLLRSRVVAPRGIMSHLGAGIYVGEV